MKTIQNRMMWWSAKQEGPAFKSSLSRFCVGFSPSTWLPPTDINGVSWSSFIYGQKFASKKVTIAYDMIHKHKVRFTIVYSDLCVTLKGSQMHTPVHTKIQS